MKTEKEIAELYVAPEIECHTLMCEGVLCISDGGTHEGVDFEEWN